MHLDPPTARIGQRDGALSRAKQLALKTLVALGGVLVLASAFVVSMVFLAIGLAVVLIGGGYLWWKTRELRQQLRARMQEAPQRQPQGDIIEGEVVRTDSPDADRRPRP